MPNAVLQRLVDERDETNRNIDRILDVTNDEDATRPRASVSSSFATRDRLQELEPQITELLDLEETRNSARDARGVLGRARREDPPPDDGDGDGDEGGGGEQGRYRTFAQYARDAILVRHAHIGSSVERPVHERATQRLQRQSRTGAHV